MRTFIKTAILFILGGAVYVAVELLWRAYSHPSMFILGGLCFLLIGGINNHFGWDMQLPLQVLIGVLMVTAAELAAGLLLNVRLGLGVWDYSHMPLNLWGQICVPYMLLWVPLVCFGVVLDDWLRCWLFGERRPYYRVGGAVLAF